MIGIQDNLLININITRVYKWIYNLKVIDKVKLTF